MKEETTLILEREDLTESSKNKNILFLNFEDFKISSKKLIKHGIILFIDNNGCTKILKNRFGDKGI